MKMSLSECLMIPESVRIPFFGGVLYRALSRYACKQVRRIDISSLSLNKESRDTTLTFTLTSFSARIDTVQNDVKVVRTHRYHRTFIQYEDQQSVQLGREAIYQGSYEKTFADLSEAYPHAFNNMILEMTE